MSVLVSNIRNSLECPLCPIYHLKAATQHIVDHIVLNGRNGTGLLGDQTVAAPELFPCTHDKIPP